MAPAGCPAAWAAARTASSGERTTELVSVVSVARDDDRKRDLAVDDAHGYETVASGFEAAERLAEEHGAPLGRWAVR